MREIESAENSEVSDLALPEPVHGVWKLQGFEIFS